MSNFDKSRTLNQPSSTYTGTGDFEKNSPLDNTGSFGGSDATFGAGSTVGMGSGLENTPTTFSRDANFLGSGSSDVGMGGSALSSSAADIGTTANTTFRNSEGLTSRSWVAPVDGSSMQDTQLSSTQSAPLVNATAHGPTFYPASTMVMPTQEPLISEPLHHDKKHIDASFRDHNLPAVSTSSKGNVDRSAITAHPKDFVSDHPEPSDKNVLKKVNTKGVEQVLESHLQPTQNQGTFVQQNTIPIDQFAAMQMNQPMTQPMAQPLGQQPLVNEAAHGPLFYPQATVVMPAEQPMEQRQPISKMEEQKELRKHIDASFHGGDKQLPLPSTHSKGNVDRTAITSHPKDFVTDHPEPSGKDVTKKVSTKEVEKVLEAHLQPQTQGTFVQQNTVPIAAAPMAAAGVQAPLVNEAAHGPLFYPQSTVVMPTDNVVQQPTASRTMAHESRSEHHDRHIDASFKNHDIDAYPLLATKSSGAIDRSAITSHPKDYVADCVEPSDKCITKNVNTKEVERVIESQLLTTEPARPNTNVLDNTVPLTALAATTIPSAQPALPGTTPLIGTAPVLQQQGGLQGALPGAAMPFVNASAEAPLFYPGGVVLPVTQPILPPTHIEEQKELRKHIDASFHGGDKQLPIPSTRSSGDIDRSSITSHPKDFVADCIEPSKKDITKSVDTKPIEKVLEHRIHPVSEHREVRKEEVHREKAMAAQPVAQDAFFYPSSQVVMPTDNLTNVPTVHPTPNTFAQAGPVGGVATSAPVSHSTSNQFADRAPMTDNFSTRDVAIDMPSTRNTEHIDASFAGVGGSVAPIPSTHSTATIERTPITSHPSDFVSDHPLPSSDFVGDKVDATAFQGVSGSQAHTTTLPDSGITRDLGRDAAIGAGLGAGAGLATASTGPTPSTYDKDSDFVSSDLKNQSIIDLVIAEHRNVDMLFQKCLDHSFSNDVRKGFRNDIIRELSMHAAKEEMVLYPFVKEKIGADLAQHAIEEHQEAKEALVELDSKPVEDSDFDLKVTKLMMDIRKHVAEEESGMLTMMQNSFSNEELVRLGKSWKSHEAIAPTRPHPSAPSSGFGAKLANMFSKPIDAMRDAFRHGADDKLEKERQLGSNVDYSDKSDSALRERERSSVEKSEHTF